MAASDHAARLPPTRLSLPSRTTLFAVVVALHLIAITVLLRSRGLPVTGQTRSALSVFDVIPPPEPPRVTPPLIRRPKPAPRSSAPEGGAPLSRPAPLVSAPAGARPVIDATLVAETPPLPPPATGDGAATVGTGIGAGGADGEGRGRGTGTGDGDGAGGGTPWRRADWIVKPTSDDVLRYWPRSARRVSATVDLACIVPKPGPVKRCTVVREQPRGRGFGRAAIAMSVLFRIRPVVQDRRDRADIPVFVPVIFEASPPRGASLPK